MFCFAHCWCQWIPIQLLFCSWILVNWLSFCIDHRCLCLFKTILFVNLEAIMHRSVCARTVFYQDIVQSIPRTVFLRYVLFKIKSLCSTFTQLDWSLFWSVFWSSYAEIKSSFKLLTFKLVVMSELTNKCSSLAFFIGIIETIHQRSESRSFKQIG